MKKCPHCWEKIQNSAKKCRFCWERLNKEFNKHEEIAGKSNNAEKNWIILKSKKIAIIPWIIFFILAFFSNYSKWFVEWILNWAISWIIIRYLSSLLCKVILKNETNFKWWQWVFYIIGWIFWIANILFWIVLSIIYSIKDKEMPYFNKNFHIRVYYRWIIAIIILLIWLFANLFF